MENANITASKQVKKRDGELVDFDRKKIVKAIESAFNDVDGKVDEYAHKRANNIADYIEEHIDDGASVEEIQDMVQAGLMKGKRPDVASSYVIYRYQHALARRDDVENRFAQKLLGTKIDNQNANVDEHSFGGRMGEANSVNLKEYALYHCMSAMSRNNHLNNEIYIHDLDHYSVGDHNCLTIPFDKLLANGFNTRQTDVRPANSINTAMQLVAVIFQLQSLNQFGGVSASHLDWTMVPYVRKSFYKHFKDGIVYIEDDDSIIKAVNEGFLNVDPKDVSIEDERYKKYPHAYKYAIDKTIQETHQAVEGMYHNLNTLQSRSGNQLK